MRHSHQKSKTLADKSFKAAACWVTGTVVCCLCSSASTIYLYSCSEADWGCPFQIRLSLFIPVATASVMVSHFLTFISFHWPPPLMTRTFSGLKCFHQLMAAPCYNPAVAAHIPPIIFPSRQPCTPLNIQSAVLEAGEMCHSLEHSSTCLPAQQTGDFLIRKRKQKRGWRCWKQMASKGLQAWWAVTTREDELLSLDAVTCNLKRAQDWPEVTFLFRGSP